MDAVVLTSLQARALARFRRGSPRWNGKIWRALDKRTIGASIMRRLRERGLVRYDKGVERYASQSRAAAFLTKEGERVLKDIPAYCRECGCTDARACPEGCSWIEPDLCSACAA